jgi:hypothetical protein
MRSPERTIEIMRSLHRSLYLCFGIAVLSTMSACNDTPYRLVGSTHPGPALPVPGCVIILPPTSSCTDLSSERPIAISAIVSDSHRQLLALRSAEAFARKGIPTCASEQSLVQSNMAMAFQTASGSNHHLAQGLITGLSRNALFQLSGGNQGVVVSATHLSIQLGPVGTYNSYSGAITGNAGKAVLYSSVFLAATSNTLWQDTVIQRELGIMDDLRLEESIQVLWGTW